jgi:hypothetical protein
MRYSDEELLEYLKELYTDLQKKRNKPCNTLLDMQGLFHPYR